MFLLTMAKLIARQAENPSLRALARLCLDQQNELETYASDQRDLFQHIEDIEK